MSLKIKKRKNIVSNGLVLHLDAYDKTSYPGSGLTWYDISGNNYNFTMLESDPMIYNSNGYFAINNDGAKYDAVITTNTTCTLVFWIKTTDQVSLFWGDGSGSFFVGAYRSGNKEYYGNCGSPDFYMDTVEKDNIYDHIRDGEWHMVEFKNVNMSSAIRNRFNKYVGYTFDNHYIGAIYMYDRNLTAAESLQNFNADRFRFGL